MRTCIFCAASLMGLMGLVAEVAVAAENNSSLAPLTLAGNAAQIIQIAVDAEGLPFLLDDAGHVWATLGLGDSNRTQLLQIKGLEHIKKIVPYEALDDKGQVFVWGMLNPVVDEMNSIIQTSYTSATKIMSLSGVTEVAHSFGHGFAVVNGNRIVTWEEVLGGEDEITKYGPIQEIYNGTKVRQLAAAAGPGPMNLIALLEDGAVVGWGITEFGQASRKRTERVELGKLPGARGIDLNGMHTVVVSEDGIPLFWGGCDMDGYSIRGYKPWIWGHLSKVALALQDVQAVSLAKDTGHGGDDNVSYDVFLKRDGTVWMTRPPIPPDAPESECGIFVDSESTIRTQQLVIGDAPAIQIAYGNGRVLVLDKQHRLWSWGNGDIKSNKIKLIELNLK